MGTSIILKRRKDNEDCFGEIRSSSVLFDIFRDTFPYREGEIKLDWIGFEELEAVVQCRIEKAKMDVERWLTSRPNTTNVKDMLEYYQQLECFWNSVEDYAITKGKLYGLTEYFFDDDDCYAYYSY